ncbi:MAG: sulfurtransferase, partial [Hyphomicrobiaceae bacterium]
MGDFFISIDELKSRIGTRSAPLLFDVCRAKAFGEECRTLPGARWREHTKVAEWAARLPANAEVVTYCVHGHNVSQLATSALREMGIRAQALEGGIEAWKAAGAPTLRKSALTARSDGKPTRWVTRVRPKIDRIACPWLVKRFVDPSAEFYFVAADQVMPVAEELGGIPYDIEGVELAHVGDGCTFDTLIERLGLVDPALAVLARIVRGADTGRPDLAPESAGLLAMSRGLSALSGDDDRAAVEQGLLFYDCLYAWAGHARAETHGRAPKHRGNHRT